MKNKCVIAGAGESTNDRIVRKDEVFYIAADGGISFYKENNIVPDLIIGDMDSLMDKALLDEYDNNTLVKHLPVEKDDTDMLAAIKEGLKQGCRYFEIYGGLGGRLDHTIANIQCLAFLDNHGARGILYGRDFVITLICNEQIILKKQQHTAGGRISVFAYGGDAHGVTEKGLKYELENAVVANDFPIGVSNEFTGEDAVIEVRDGKLLVCVDRLVTLS